MISESNLESRASPGARAIIKLALQIQADHKHPYLGTNHWLTALMQRHGGMIVSLTGWDAVTEALNKARAALGDGDCGTDMSVEGLIEAATTISTGRGKPCAAEKDIALAVLEAAGIPVVEVPEESYPEAGSTDGEPMRFASADIPQGGALDRFGTDLTARARKGELAPIVGRDDETALVVETLCRRTKRNPVLIGPAGVGKTAVVEGLAQRIVKGDVPQGLQNCRVIALQPSVLVAGSGMVGELEKRLEQVLQEARKPGIILFIDEIHAIIGAGGRPGSSDLASLLKPSLARGEISCIAATTDDEYRRYVEQDRALERRFQPVKIQELDRDATLQVMRSLRDSMCGAGKMAVSDEVLEWLIQFAADHMRNRHFPDKAVDLLEQVVARAVALEKAEVDYDAARDVAQRVVGMPLSLPERLEGLERSLAELGVVSPDEIEALSGRLQLSLRGLDIRPERPAAVVLLLGMAAQQASSLAEAVSSSLFGSAERITELDLGGFTHWSDTHRLIGSGPGYVGYSERLPIHALAQMPWSVLLLRGLETCDSSVRDLIRSAISRGSLTDGSGKNIYFSDAVILISLPGAAGDHARLGLRDSHDGGHSQGLERISSILGDSFIDEIDITFAGEVEDNSTGGVAVYRNLLKDLADRYLRNGIDLRFDDSVLDWMVELQASAMGAWRDWERLVEDEIAHAMVPVLEAPPESKVAPLKMVFKGKHLEVHKVQRKGEDELQE